ncbi:ribosomal maturation YjgA family protein [Arthrobacter humicola]
MSIALGLSIRTLSDAAWTGPAGDGLYAVLVYVLVAILIPSQPKALIAAAAVTACVMIELFQLTGIPQPAELGKSWPPLRLVLGTTFGTADLLAYAGGAAFAYAVDRTTYAVVNSSSRH